jgi:hypothetical protein
MWPSVVFHEHWLVSQRMIVEMRDYAWSEHIVTFDWSHDHLGWTIRTWRRVHWSDESRFLLRPTDGRARVWRQRSTSFQDNHILGTTYAWSEHIVTVFLTCQITIKNVQIQLTVKRKTTPDSYTPIPKAVVPKMRARRPIKRKQLTLRHRHARFDWSHDHLGWTIRTWRRVHWSDESRFLLRPTDGRARV